jgi:nicotinic acid mononucleotide adenylyltransferase
LENWSDCVAIARPPYRIESKSCPEKGIYVCQDDGEQVSDVSSTEIRRRIERGESLEGLVYPSVERYLKGREKWF